MDVETAEPATNAFRRDERGARAEKYRLAPPRDVLDDIGDQRGRRDGRVQWCGDLNLTCAMVDAGQAVA
jgi:hypothetical protein